MTGDHRRWAWTRRALLTAAATQVAACGLLGGGDDLASEATAAPKSRRQEKLTSRVREWDRELKWVVDDDARIEVLAEGFTWAEGPVWVGGYNGGYLLFSDVQANVVHRWSAAAGVEDFLNPSGFAGEDPALREPGANGLILGRPGELLMCDCGNRAVVSVDLFSKRRATLVDRFQGKRLNSPNDLVLARSGAIYFTDPPYGLAGLNESPVKELAFNGVYRLAPDGRLALLDDTLGFPNGVALSPDEATLYVSNSDPTRPVIRAYALNDRGVPSSMRTFFDATALLQAGGAGLPDGMAVDKDGRILATAPGGVVILAPDGRALGMIECNYAISNCAFGEDGRSLFLSAENKLARIRLVTSGKV